MGFYKTNFNHQYLSILGEEDEEGRGTDIIESANVPLISLNCPQQLSNLKEEDVRFIYCL